MIAVEVRLAGSREAIDKTLAAIKASESDECVFVTQNFRKNRDDDGVRFYGTLVIKS